jgi:hypothetical protein
MLTGCGQDSLETVPVDDVTVQAPNVDGEYEVQSDSGLNMEIIQNIGKTLDEARETMPDLQYIKRNTPHGESAENNENSFLFPSQGGVPGLAFGDTVEKYAYVIKDTEDAAFLLEWNDDPSDDVDPEMISHDKEIEAVEGYVGTLVNDMPQSMPIDNFLDALGVAKIGYVHDLGGYDGSGNLWLSMHGYDIVIYCRSNNGDGPRTIQSDYPMAIQPSIRNDDAGYDDYHKLIDAFAILSYGEAVKTLKSKLSIGDDYTVEYSLMFRERYAIEPREPYYLTYSAYVLKVTDTSKAFQTGYLPNYYSVEATTGNIKRIDYPGLIANINDGAGINIQSAPGSGDPISVIGFVPSGRTEVILIGPGEESRGRYYTEDAHGWFEDGYVWYQIEIPQWFREEAGYSDVNGKASAVGWVREDFVKLCDERPQSK